MIEVKVPEYYRTDHSLDVFAVGARTEGGANHSYRIKGGAVDMNLTFQNGPINEVGVNGITHEALLTILIHRLEGFQSRAYACRENALALTKLEEALMWLNRRTQKREERGVEGTHTV